MKIYKIADTEDAVPLGLAEMPVEVQKYGERTWGVFFGGELLCVAVYLRGAKAVQTLVRQLQAELRQAEEQGSFILVDRATEIPGGQDEQAYA